MKDQTKMYSFRTLGAAGTFTGTPLPLSKWKAKGTVRPAVLSRAIGAEYMIVNSSSKRILGTLHPTELK